MQILNMDRKEITKAVVEYADEFGPTNRPERKAVEKLLRNVKHSELFEGLFTLFLLEDGPNTYTRQQNAGVILYKLKPKVYIDLKQRIRLSLKTWNVSVEEWPFYLVEKCGKDRVLEVLDELAKERLSDRERSGMETFSYWLKKSR
ncbi:hypothetical protein FE810_16945 [Thalassotalea litorea]|uniref:Uncharacterized protein n=1 Tax=Thalassotalea litorea TaxID=2020715 RepID=A0A5R9IHN0_9GAMM|nr:hypothetical protein [Thalassotalea litorea]TLU59457.1 hypothetical protein FE810_16945 [Thalassotalea litorea]